MKSNLRIPAICLLIPILCGSRCDDPPVPPADQAVEQIAVLPAVVHVAPGDEVILTARLLGYDDKLIVLPEWVRDVKSGKDSVFSQFIVVWSFTPEIPPGITRTTVSGSPGNHRTRIIVAPGTLAGTSAKITATAGGREASAKLLVMPSGTSPTPGATQSSVSADGFRVFAQRTGSSPDTDWLLRAFSESAQPAPPSSTPVFGAWLERDHGLAFSTSTLITNSQAVNQPTRPVIDLPIRFWIATSGLPADGSACDSVCRLKLRAVDDLALANQIFEDNRTGVRFVGADPIGGANGIIIHELSSVADFGSRTCSDLYAEITAVDSPVPQLKAQIDLRVIHIVYSQGKNDDARGIECTYSDGTGFLVVFLYNRAPTSLAHELGHALGLDTSTGLAAGHPTGADVGFDAGNLMWTNLDLRQATDRSRLLVGQSIWQNLDTGSFLNLALEDPFTTGSQVVRPIGLPRADCTIPESQCPAVALRLESAQ